MSVLTSKCLIILATLLVGAPCAFAEVWDTLVSNKTSTQTVSIETFYAWEVEAVFTGLKPRNSIDITGKYPQLLYFAGKDSSNIALGLNGYNNGRNFFMPGSGVPATTAGTTVGSVNLNNNNVANYNALWPQNGGTLTVRLVNDTKFISVYIDGSLIIKTDKNVTDGMISSITVGSGLANLGGGTIQHVKIRRFGRATVVRAHPRLTAGLERESLIGIRFKGYDGVPSRLDFRFDLTNCTADAITDVRLWRQPFGKVPFAFYERDAEELTNGGGLAATRTVGADGSLTVSFAAAGTGPKIYASRTGRDESDYVWLTAKIDPAIAKDAEIWASLEGGTMTLGANDYTVLNGRAKNPHRPFPSKYQISAYMRQDWLAGNGKTSRDLFDNYPDLRFKNLTDLLIIYSAKPTYSAANGFTLTWNVNGQNDDASTARLVNLRDTYNPDCRVRLSIMRNTATITSGGISGNPLVVCGQVESSRKQFAAYLVRFLKEHRLDGLDIDWEWPPQSGQATTWIALGKMMREISEQFFDHDLTLSLSWRSNDVGAPGSAQYGAFHAPDYITSQAYGGGYINSGPSIQRRALKVCTDRGVPSRRVIMGQAIFASNGQWRWDQAPSYIDAVSPDPFRRYDIDTFYVGNDYRVFEGPSTYHVQCNWARKQETGGVMSWGYYCDTAWYNFYSLARAQASAIWPYPAVWPTPEKDGETYLIDSEEDWSWLREHSGVSARLTADFTISHDPLPIETWTGDLDGAGRTVTVAADAWICGEAEVGLIKTLKGRVRNMNIVVKGRVYTLAGRWNDQAESPSTGRNANRTSGTNPVGVLAAKAADGAEVAGVSVTLAGGTEVKGVSIAGGLVGNVTGAATVTNNSVTVGGKIHLEVRNIWDTEFEPASPSVGVVVGCDTSAGAAVLAGNGHEILSTARVTLYDPLPDIVTARECALGISFGADTLPRVGADGEKFIQTGSVGLPLALNGLGTAPTVMTATFAAEIAPSDATGALFGWMSGTNRVQLVSLGDGTFDVTYNGTTSHPGTVRYAAEDPALRHVYTVCVTGNAEPGVRVYQDGRLIVDAPNVRWGSTAIAAKPFAIGTTVDGSQILSGLRVYGFKMTTSAASLDESAAYVDPFVAGGNLEGASLDDKLWAVAHVFNRNGSTEAPDVTVNGEVRTGADAISALRLFWTPDAAATNIVFRMEGIDPASGRIGCRVEPRLRNGTMALLGAETPSGPWVCIPSEYGAAEGEITLELNADEFSRYHFYKIKAE